MQDVISKLVSVFVAKVLLEIPIYFVCHLLDLLSVHQGVDRIAIVNTEHQTNVFVILDFQAIRTVDVKAHNRKHVQI